MATPNIVPRANNEGNLGTSAKKWKKMYTTTGFQIGVDNSSGTFQMNSGDNGQLIWEGSASDAHQTKLQAVNPTADLIYKLPLETSSIIPFVPSEYILICGAELLPKVAFTVPSK